MRSCSLRPDPPSDNEMSAISVNGQAVSSVVAGSFSAFESRELTGMLVVGTTRSE